MLQRFLFIVFIITCLGFNSESLGQTSEFNQAVIAINAEKYSEGAQILQNLVDSSQVQSVELYYNLGFAYLKNGQLGQSILSLERAKLLDPKNEQVTQLLSIANEKVEVKITHIPNFILMELYESAAMSFSSNVWAFMQVIFFILFLLLLYLRLFRNYDSRNYTIPIGISLALLLICLALTSKRRVIALTKDTAIFMDKKGYIYSGADDRSEAVADISEGVKMYIIDRIGDWYKVELDDKDIGWVQKEKVAIR